MSRRASHALGGARPQQRKPVAQRLLHGEQRVDTRLALRLVGELRRLIRNATVTCQVLDTDRYGRSVAECSAGNVNLNDAMVRAGWAIAYTRHGQDHAAAENEARAARRGIWQGTFQRPEAWRNANRQGLMDSDSAD